MVNFLISLDWLPVPNSIAENIVINNYFETKIYSTLFRIKLPFFAMDDCFLN